MSLTSWSEPSMLRNLRQLDPFQRRRNQLTLAQVARAIRLHSAVVSRMGVHL